MKLSTILAKSTVQGVLAVMALGTACYLAAIGRIDGAAFLGIVVIAIGPFGKQPEK